jgi:hypothetical protein
MSIEAGTKFLGLSSEVDTTERRSAQINKKSEHYTIEDITSHISLEVQGSIEIPEAVDADTIVDQLDAENYDTIRSNVKGYKSTIISIPIFDLSELYSNVQVGYTEHGFTILGNPFPALSYDEIISAFSVTIENPGVTLGYARASILPPANGDYTLTEPVKIIASAVDDGNDFILKVAVEQLDGTVLDNTSLLRFGLELEFRTY